MFIFWSKNVSVPCTHDDRPPSWSSSLCQHMATFPLDLRESGRALFLRRGLQQNSISHFMRDEHLHETAMARLRHGAVGSSRWLDSGKPYACEVRTTCHRLRHKGHAACTTVLAYLAESANSFWKWCWGANSQPRSQASGPQHSPERTSLDKLPNELTIRGRVAQMRYSGSAEPMSAEFWTLQRKTSKYFCFCNSHIPEVVYSVPRVIAHVTPSVFATPTTQNYKHP